MKIGRPIIQKGAALSASFEEKSNITPFELLYLTLKPDVFLLTFSEIGITPIILLIVPLPLSTHPVPPAVPLTRFPEESIRKTSTSLFVPTNLPDVLQLPLSSVPPIVFIPTEISSAVKPSPQFTVPTA